MTRHELDPADTGKWNANIHYHDVVLENLPERRDTALDVGCGEGILTRQLAPEFTEVTGVDLHAESIATAKAITAAENVHYVVDDFMTMDLAPDHHDLVASVVTVHQMDTAAALERMRYTTRPGGRIVIVGVTAPEYVRDAPRLGVALVVNNAQYIRGRRYRHSAPMTWPPPHNASELKKIAHRVLPGARFTREWLNRVTIVWHKPAS